VGPLVGVVVSIVLRVLYVLLKDMTWLAYKVLRVKRPARSFEF
jgi:hypothetical protein